MESASGRSRVFDLAEGSLSEFLSASHSLAGSFARSFVVCVFLLAFAALELHSSYLVIK